MTSFEHTNNLPLAGDILDDFAIIFRELLNKVKLKQKTMNGIDCLDMCCVSWKCSKYRIKSNDVYHNIAWFAVHVFFYDKGESSTNQNKIIVFRRFGRLSITNGTHIMTTQCFVVQHLIKVALFLR